MNLILRMLRVLIGAVRRGGLQPLDESVVTFRVLPNDLDVFWHMNNGRYPSIMDLGRLDLITRVGLTRFMFTHRWFPLVAASNLRFRRPLKPFQKYQLKTRIAYWDDKWFYLEQRFIRRGELIAVGWIKALMRGPKGNVDTKTIFSAIGFEPNRPAMPETVAHWLALEQSKQQID